MMFKSILFVGLLYPLLWVVDKSTDSNTLMNYHVFVMQWWPVGVALLITMRLLKKISLFRFNEMEIMRARQYSYEIQRYSETPYIPAIMLMYLKNPPASFSPSIYNYINNTFYRSVVNGFRDTVYRMSDFSSFEPAAHPNFIKVVGFQSIIRLLGYFSSGFVWLAYWLFTDPTAFLYGWQLFTLPIVILFLTKATIMLQAITSHLPQHLDRQLEMENGPNSKVPWREVFPDHPLGITITRAYLAEKEKRMRYESSFNGMIVPESVEHYNNTNFPPYPFPSKDIPEWTEDFEVLYETKTEKIHKQPILQGNVIPLRRRKQH